MAAMALRLFVFSLVIGACCAFGGEAPVTIAAPQEQKNEAPLWSFDVKSDYTFGSKIMKAASLGSQAAYHYEVEALRDFHLFDKYYLQFGADWERFDFSRSNNVFPYALSSVAAEMNVAYWTGDEFYPLLKLGPGVYYTRDYITKNSFDIPIRAVAGVKIFDNVHLVLGIDADLFEEQPVIPLGGFNWKINDQFNLRAVFPEPRFSYTPNQTLEFFIAGDFVGGGYRNGPTNDRRTNDAILDYTGYRADGGIGYNPRKGLSIEATVGWSIQRRFDYFRSGPDFSSKSAPYMKLDVSIDLF
ncbi:MAG: hypothetical protein JO251_13700 [Verrucomicrobia bacterium]|nr:hypothetical protein [Verrucomicrobiota bacterium]